MRLLSSRVLRALLILISTCLVAAVARADLVWTPSTGWRVEGGALSGLTGPQGRNALEIMNKARANEEGGRLNSAIKSYIGIGRK